jgi:hypothetical protein
VQDVTLSGVSMSETTGPDGQPDECAFCGATPTLSRRVEDERFNPGMCRRCLVAVTQRTLSKNRKLCGFTDNGEGSPVSAEAGAEVEMAWARFDSAMATHRLLSGIEHLVDSEVETVDYGWSGGPANESPTQMMEDVARARFFLESHGYREVSVVTGIDRELAAKGQLGGFYSKLDVDRPRWAAKVVFRKIVDPGLKSQSPG